MKIFAFIILLNAGRIIKSNDDVVNYYERMIEEEIEKSSKYQYPTNAEQYKPKNDYPEDFGWYDFVIVGGGSAGAVVASRLSEVNNWKVLLLEAGKAENNFTDIPSMSTFSIRSDYNWGFNSTPQTTCCLATEGICPFPRGRALGGTSALNALIYVRGNRADYDKWTAEGNPGWSYEEVLPYFIKSENSHINGDEGYHGSDGYLKVNYHKPSSDKVEVFLKANQVLGHPIGDYNGKEQLKVSRTQFTTVNGRRESSAKAFLGPASNRPNLHILTESYVMKVLVSNTSKTAYGIVFSRKNIQYIVKAKKEIILSAGVVGSPQLLMLSGMGPKGHLNNHQIPVVQDLDIGLNLHDHLTFYSMYFQSSQSEPSLGLKDAIKQFLNGTGPFTISTNPQALGFYHLGLTNSSAPDLEIVFIPSNNSHGFADANKGFCHGDVNQVGSKNNIFQFVLVLLHPKTRGRIHLKSANPFDYPLIHSTCLADPADEDIENMYKGVQAALELTKTSAFMKLNATLLPIPLCEAHPFLSKEYWVCLIRQTATNAFHGAGTCKMGPNPSKGAVVDNRLRVHGVKNLRVADTSVIPVTLSAHMHAPAMMIGEKLADFIKQDNNYF